MKYLLIFFFIHFFNLCSSQSNNCNIKFSLSNNLNKQKEYVIKFITHQPDPNNKEIRINPIKIQKSKQLIVNCKEPFHINAELYLDDSLVAATNSFIITNESLNIEFIPLPKISFVSGEENKIKSQNDLLFLELPAKIVNSKGYHKNIVKNSYTVKIPENRYLEAMYKEYEATALRTVQSNKDYFFTLDHLYDKNDNFSINTLEKCYNALSEKYKKTSIAIKLKEIIKNRKRLLKNESIPKFEVLNTFNKLIISDSIYTKSEFTFIDFWASWCVPCREKMQFYKPLFKRIDSLQLNMVSISIDTNITDWKKAIQKDGIDWANYVDTTGTYGNIATLFALSYIPQNVLVDSKGKFIAFNITDNELLYFMKEKKVKN